jgi:hypothetical protein
MGFSRCEYGCYLIAMFNVDVAFNQDLTEWNLTSVKYTNRMFATATAFDKDMCGWADHVLANGPTMAGLFDDAGCPTDTDPSICIVQVGHMCHYCSTFPCNEDFSRSCVGFTSVLSFVVL